MSEVLVFGMTWPGLDSNQRPLGESNHNALSLLAPKFILLMEIVITLIIFTFLLCQGWEKPSSEQNVQPDCPTIAMMWSRKMIVSENKKRFCSFNIVHDFSCLCWCEIWWRYSELWKTIAATIPSIINTMIVTNVRSIVRRERSPWSSSTSMGNIGLSASAGQPQEPIRRPQDHCSPRGSAALGPCSQVFPLSQTRLLQVETHMKGQNRRP